MFLYPIILIERLYEPGGRLRRKKFPFISEAVPRLVPRSIMFTPIKTSEVSTSDILPVILPVV
jgi:hypothetical protein